MRNIHTIITLKNAIDVGCRNYGIIREPEVRQTTVQAMVDTGTETLVINEALRKELGLRLMERQEAILINNAIKMCRYTGPVEIHWRNHSVVVRAAVPEDAQKAVAGRVLLGALPLEKMGLVIDSARLTLAAA